MKNIWMVGLALLLPLTVAGKERRTINVKAVTSRSHDNEFTSTSTTPETSETQCSGGGSATSTTWGDTTHTNIGTNTTCHTTTTPAETHTQTYVTSVDVVSQVESDGMAYTISCKATWVGSNCLPLDDGDTFKAEIDDKTMWVYVRKGGNQGKVVRAKFKILDIRPLSVTSPVPTSSVAPYAQPVTEPQQAIEERQDGHWWKVQETNYQLGFLFGYVAGLNNVSHIIDPDGTNYPGFHFGNYTIGQMQDELQQFYSDPSNQHIEVYGAITWVKAKIEGSSQQELQRALEFLRKESSK